MNFRSLRWAAAAATSLALLAPVQAQAGGRPEPMGPAADPASRPHVLARSGHGAAVLTALGDRLPEVAATNGLTTAKLRTVLEDDPTAWVGQDGQLFYVEKATALAGSTGLVAGAATATYPESQTFALHSLPGSTHTIYLDFDGASVTNTWWNTASGGMPARTYTGFTLDGDPSTFTSAELAYIQQVWRIVAEKYSPFDVDVTTQDPGAAGYNRNGVLDTSYGDHVLITDDAGAVQAACSSQCSGIALVNTFDDPSDSNGYLEPAWVFSSMTWDSAILTAHTVAHEVGHTFGLTHDGDTTPTEYYEGHGNWFPIMGSGVEGVGQFSKGEYAGANNTQDDLAIIASNGAPARLDDHLGLLSLLADSVPTGGVAGGVIGYSPDPAHPDQDVFVVNHGCTTNLTARATGVGAGASLDMKVTVLDALGNVVGSADPASGQTASWPALPTGMDAQVSVPAGVGTYYVRVEGVGSGNPVTNGYSGYGSVGEYVLAISACDGTMPVVTTPVAPPTTPTTPTTPTPTTPTAAGSPSAPRIGLARSGRRGGAITASAHWAPPASSGGSTVTGYKILAQKLGSSGRVVKVFTTRMLAAGSRDASLRLTRGRYQFTVVAYNRAGASPTSATSNAVRAR